MFFQISFKNFISMWSKNDLCTEYFEILRFLIIFRLSNSALCVKSVRIWISSGPYLLAFSLNKKRYSVSLRIQNTGNMDQNNSEYEHFLRSGYFQVILMTIPFSVNFHISLGYNVMVLLSFK